MLKKETENNNVRSIENNNTSRFAKARKQSGRTIPCTDFSCPEGFLYGLRSRCTNNRLLQGGYASKAL